MKILFSLTYYRPYVSGLTLAAARWAEGLAQSGETVTVLAMQHGKSLPLQERINRVFVKRASWIVTVSKGFVSLDWWIKSWRLVGVHDVVVINLPQFEGIIPALAAKLRGKRVIAIYHCEVALPPGWINSVIQSLLEVSNFATLWLADCVVTYTKDYARHSRLLTLLRTYGKRNIFSIVPPVSMPKEKKTLTKKLRSSIGAPSLVVGVAARLASEKGLEYLFEAIPIIQSLRHDKKVRIVIAGSMDPVGEHAYKNTITKLVKKYKQYVTFLGEIQPKEMGSFYALLDVLVLPSVNSTEAFGLVQVEAMLSGVPVVVSDIPGVRVPVQKTGMGLTVPPKDSDALAKAINMIAENKAMYVKDVAYITRIFSEGRSVREFSRLL